jgi:integrase
MPPMGRRPTVNLNLPSRMRARTQKSGAVYYYYDTGKKPRKEIPLGNNYPAAVRKWAELEADGLPKASKLITFKDVVDQYRRDVIPNKASRTQDDNNAELNKILEFFAEPPVPLEDIKPINIREYMDWRTSRGKHSTVRANRERALISHIWNKAREWGVTDKENPCKGITGFTETGRDIYIEDDIFKAVYSAADGPTKDALDLAYLTGQRPADVVAMSEMHITGDVLNIDQGKTKKKLRMSVEGQLSKLIKRIKERKKGYKLHSLALICSETGRPLSKDALRQRFEKARAKAAKDNPKLAADIKAGSDKTDTEDMHQAQKQLGHSNIKMTEHYVRQRRGDVVKPTK